MKHPVFCKIFDVNDRIEILTTPKHSIILERFLFLTGIEWEAHKERYEINNKYFCSLPTIKSYHRLIKQLEEWDSRYDITRTDWQHKMVKYLRKFDGERVT